MSFGDISKTDPKRININDWLDSWYKKSEAYLKHFEQELNKKNGGVMKNHLNEESTPARCYSKEQLVPPAKQSPVKHTSDMSVNYEEAIEKMVTKAKKWIITKTTGDRPLIQTSEEFGRSSHEITTISKETLERKVQEALNDTNEGSDVKEEVKEEYLQAFPADTSKVADNPEIDIFLKEELAESSLKRRTEFRRRCVVPSCNDSVSAENASDLYHEMSVHVYKEHPDIEGPLKVPPIHKVMQPPVSMSGKKEARHKRLKKLLLKSTLSCDNCPSRVSIEEWLPHTQSHMEVADPFQCPFCNFKAQKTNIKKRSCLVFIHSTDKHFTEVKNTSVTAKEKTHKVYELIRSLDRKFDVKAYRDSARFGQTLPSKERGNDEEVSSVVARNSSIVCNGSNSSQMNPSLNSSSKPCLKRKYSILSEPSPYKKRRRRSSFPDDCVVMVDVSARPVCYTCTHCCNQQFTNKEAFSRHGSADHPVCNLKCHDCLEIFTDVHAHVKNCQKQLENLKQESGSDYSSGKRLAIDLARKSSMEPGSSGRGVKKGETISGKDLQKKSVTDKPKFTSDTNRTPGDKHESTKAEIVLSVGVVEVETKENTGVESNNVQPKPRPKFKLSFRNTFPRPLFPSKQRSITKPSEGSPKHSKVASSSEKAYESSGPDIIFVENPEIKEAQRPEIEIIKEVAKKERLIEEVVNAANRRYKPSGLLFYCNYKECRRYLPSERDLRLHMIVAHYYCTTTLLYICFYSGCKIAATNFEKEMRPHLLQAHGNTFKKLVESSFREAAELEKVINCNFRKCGFIAKNFEDLNEHTLLHNNFLSEKIRRLPLGNLTWSVLWAHNINNRQDLDKLTHTLHEGFCPPCNKKIVLKSSFQVYYHLTEHMKSAKDKRAYHKSMWLVA